MPEILEMALDLILAHKAFFISAAAALILHICVKKIDADHRKDPQYEYEQAKRIEEYEKRINEWHDQ